MSLRRLPAARAESPLRLQAIPISARCSCIRLRRGPHFAAATFIGCLQTRRPDAGELPNHVSLRATLLCPDYHNDDDGGDSDSRKCGLCGKGASATRSNSARAVARIHLVSSFRFPLQSNRRSQLFGTSRQQPPAHVQVNGLPATHNQVRV